MPHPHRTLPRIQTATITILLVVCALFSYTFSAHAMTASVVDDQVSRIENQLDLLEQLLTKLSGTVPSVPQGEVLSHTTSDRSDTNQGSDDSSGLSDSTRGSTEGNEPSPGGADSDNSAVGSGGSGGSSSGNNGSVGAQTNSRDAGGPERMWEGQAERLDAYFINNGKYRCKSTYYSGTKDLCTVPSFLQSEKSTKSTSTRIAQLKQRAELLSGHIDLFIKELMETQRRIELFERSTHSTASSTTTTSAKTFRLTPTSGTAPLTVSIQGVPSSVLTKMMNCKVSKGNLGTSGNGLFVNWGDGVVSPSASSTLGSSCANSVMHHTYRKSGVYQVTVTSWKRGTSNERITEWKGTAQVVVTPKP